jgi:hypothetical protein
MKEILKSPPDMSDGEFSMKTKHKISEGQETGAIALAPENARKKFEGCGRSHP